MGSTAAFFAKFSRPGSPFHGIDADLPFFPTAAKRQQACRILIKFLLNMIYI
jgi:hypothetical protein